MYEHCLEHIRSGHKMQRRHLLFGLAGLGLFSASMPKAASAYEPRTFAFYFSHARFVVDEDFLEAVADAGRLWPTCHAYRFVLTGYHGDEAGETNNKSLALARADDIAQRLTRSGVSADRIVIRAGDANIEDYPFSASDVEALKRRVVLTYEFRGKSDEYGCLVGGNTPDDGR